jgi:hypothetical protein
LLGCCLSSTIHAQAVLPRFNADNSGVASPAYAKPHTPDAYSDDPDMRFRNGLSSFDQELATVPTYQSIGIYWAPAGGASATQATVQFRKQGDTDWSKGLPLWYDPRNKEYRGSIVMLAPGTSDEISLALETGATASTTQATWTDPSQLVPGQTIYVRQDSATYHATTSGNPDSYVLYTADPAQNQQLPTIDMGAGDLHSGDGNSCVVVEASYVIIRGLKLANCQRQGIEIKANQHDVIIEENDISGFGSAPSGTESPIAGATNKIIPGKQYEAGIYCQNAYEAIAKRVNRVTIQRNKIHDPRYGSVSWEYGHPNSAQAVNFNHCGSNHVIRYNSIYSTPGHYFNDGIGGLSNSTFEGFPNADSDINGNDISGVYDDGIESEGANRNVRIWGNYLHHVYDGIAMAVASQGPAYVFRNVLNDTVGMHDPSKNQDDVDHATFFKLGGDQLVANGGRIYLFHNTNIQAAPPAGSGLLYGMGAGGGPANAGGVTCNIVSRNNVFIASKDWQTVVNLNIPATACGANDPDFDAYVGSLPTGAPASWEAHGKQGKAGAVIFAAAPALDPKLNIQTYTDYLSPTYATGPVFLTTALTVPTNFQLNYNSLGAGLGTYLPNFNDLATGADPGAHQRGAPNMQFGTEAYRPPQ